MKCQHLVRRNFKPASAKGVVRGGFGVFIYFICGAGGGGTVLPAIEIRVDIQSGLRIIWRLGLQPTGEVQVKTALTDDTPGCATQCSFKQFSLAGMDGCIGKGSFVTKGHLDVAWIQEAFNPYKVSA